MSVAFLLVAGACAPGRSDESPRLDQPARRVVSLVPSVTEIFLALGAGELLVARTRYDEAAEIAHLPSVGGGLDPSAEAIIALRPDLVVAWNLRDERILRPRLVAAGIPVYAVAIEDTTDVYRTIEGIGALIGRSAAADSLTGALADTLAAIARRASGARAAPGGGARPAPTVFFLLPGAPARTAGSGTFIAQLIGVAGGRSAFPAIEDSWPAISLEAVVARQPEVILLPVVDGDGGGDGGRRWLEARPGWRDLDAVRSSRVIGLPADLLTRPGPRMGLAARLLARELERVARTRVARPWVAGGT